MERSGFFDSEVVGQNPDGSLIYDREYLSEFFALYFSSFIGNGIFPNPSTNLQIVSNNDMTITIKQGQAWINGYFYINTDDLIFEISTADGVLNRIDRVVLRLDFLERKIKAVVKKGDYASSAIAKTLQRDNDAYEIALADIRVNAGTISIIQGNITDTRLDKNLCGIVHGTIKQVDTTTIFNQYLDWFKKTKGQAEINISTIKSKFENEFTVWFDGIKDILDGDIAAKLAVKTVELQNKISTLNGAGEMKEKTNKTEFDEFKQKTASQMGDKMNKKIADDAATKKYELGIKNGLLYYREVL